MSCRAFHPLLSAERDRPLTDDERATLERHLAGCPACRETRAQLAAAAGSWVRTTAAIPTPDFDETWDAVRERLVEPARPRAQRRLPDRPALWASLPLAAAAAVALVVWTGHPAAPATPLPRADFVEAGDARAATVVYVDQDSGWLVVWAASPGGSSG